MTRIKVEFDLDIPDAVFEVASREEVDEWLCFELGRNCGLKVTNPLYKASLEPEARSIYWRTERGG